MGVLEQVTNLKDRGISENEIIGIMKEQGVSPKEINDALGQAQIKSAVSADEYHSDGMEQSIMRPEKTEELPTEGGLSDEDLTPPKAIPSFEPRKFKPSTRELSESGSEDEYVPHPQNIAAQEQEEYIPQPENQQNYYQQPVPQQSQNYPAQQQEYYPQNYQQGYNYEYPAQNTDSNSTDTMIEIAEQVFLEKIKTMKKQLDDMSEFRAIAETKLENMSHRLKRIEENIDRLQSEILEKVGSYGRGLDSMKKELGMVQDSFGKVVGNLAEKAEHHTVHKKTTVVHKSRSKKK